MEKDLVQNVAGEGKAQLLSGCNNMLSKNAKMFKLLCNWMLFIFYYLMHCDNKWNLKFQAFYKHYLKFLINIWLWIYKESHLLLQKSTGGKNTGSVISKHHSLSLLFCRLQKFPYFLKPL